jgi:hypothetical protein
MQFRVDVRQFHDASGDGIDDWGLQRVRLAVRLATTGLASLLPEPFGKLAVSVGAGLTDVAQALPIKSRQFISLPDSEAPKPEQCPRPEEHAPAPPARWPIKRYLIIYQHGAGGTGHETLFIM